MNGGRTHGKRREIENVIDPIPVIVTDLITVIPIKFCGTQRSRRLLRTTQTNTIFLTLLTSSWHQIYREILTSRELNALSLGHKESPSLPTPQDHSLTLPLSCKNFRKPRFIVIIIAAYKHCLLS
jgi:hypothetical protein